MKWLGPGGVALIGALGLHRSWGKWLEPMVDFGRELYVPWQIVSGKHLYAEIAYFNGPFSPMWNSLVFKSLGTNLMSLVWVNIGALTLITVLLFHLIATIASRMSATLATAFFVSVFALGHLTPAANYNFVTPYSHEMTHGAVLSLLAFTALGAYLKSPRLAPLLLAGLLLGLVFLTKAEFLVALGPSLLVGIVLSAHYRKGGLVESGRDLLVLLGVAGSTVLLAFLALVTALAPSDAARGVVGSWQYLFDPELRDLWFYKWSMGTADVRTSALLLGKWSIIWLAVFLPAMTLAALHKKLGRGLPAATALVSLIVGIILISSRQSSEWLEAARPLGLFTAAFLILQIRSFLGPRNTDNNAPRRRVLSISLLVFSLLLLLKILLYPRLHHYGFALSMPATMLLIASLTAWLPDYLDRHGWSGETFKYGAVVIFVATAISLSSISLSHYGQKVYQVGEGADWFFADYRGPAIQQLIDRVSSPADAHLSLAVLPEGAMLNYLSRRANPTPYIVILPPEVIMFGADRIVDSLREARPDQIVMTNRGTSEYGYKYLGRGYGESITNWVESTYSLVEIIEDPQFKRVPFTYSLLLEPIIGPKTSAP